MLLDYRKRRIVGVTSLAAAVLGLSAVATLAATNPAAANAALKSIASSVTCATSAACVIGDNTSSGPGVQGIGYSSYGVEGSSSGASGVKGTGNTNYGVEGVSNKNYGVWGNTATGLAGVAGTSASSVGIGVYGYTTTVGGSTIGVYGLSPDFSGVYGVTSSGTGFGVAGYAPGSGTGTYGGSDSGNGVWGYSDTGNAVYADSSGGYGLNALSNSNIGVYSYSGGSSAAVYAQSASGFGVQAYSAGPETFYGRNSNGDGADIEGTYIGIIGRAPNTSTGYPLLLTDQSANDLFFVNGLGDVYTTGSYNTFSTISKGVAVTSYGAKTSTPTLEDTGTAQLVAGYAAVRLDSTFAASIDTSTAYRVFLTPNGDTNVLYVPTKTPSGFIVREAKGGRSTVTFDYRIVATSLGHAGQRMALVSTAALPNGGALPAHQIAPVKKISTIPRKMNSPK